MLVENFSKILIDFSLFIVEVNNKGVLYLVFWGFIGKFWNFVYGKILDIFLV